MISKKKELVTEDFPPCPYCAHPEMFREPNVKPSGEVHPILRAGKFWNPKYTSGLIKTVGYGDQWRGVVPPKAMASRFKDFSVVLIGVDVAFKIPPPLPFPNHILSIRGQKPKVVPNPDFPNAALTVYSACVITHKRSHITLEAHWWPTHGKIINLRGQLSSDSTNEDLEIAKDALQFFRTETRGNPKVSEEGVAAALKSLGPRATQKEVAQELGVTESGIERWRLRRKMTWEQIKEQYNS